MERKGWEDQILNDLERRESSSAGSDSAAGSQKQSVFVSPLKFILGLYWTLCYRLKLFTLTMVIVGLALYSRGDFGTQRKEMGLSALQWSALLGGLFVVDMLMTIVDHLFFFCLESFWVWSYEFVYYMYSWHGPMGHLLTVAIAVNFLPAVHIAVEPYIDVRKCITTLIIVILLYTLKSYLIRVNYTRLLELRLKSRLDVIELWAGMISDLASSQSESTSCTEASHQEHQGTMSPMHPPRRTNSSTLQIATMSAAANDSGWVRDRGVSEPGEVPRGDGSTQKPRKRRQSFQGSKIRYLSELKDANPNGSQSEDWEEVEEVDGDSARTFWNRLKALKSGSLQISTSSGVVLIERRKQAIEFGRYVYQCLLTEAEEECSGPAASGGVPRAEITKKFLLDKIEKGMGGGGVPRGSKSGRYSNRHALTMELFRVGAMAPDETITEAKIIGAVVRAFKEFKFASVSLHDLKALHKSVLTIVDVIFWIFMFLLAQIILEVNTSRAIAPVLTVVFGLSFAFGPAVSNVFLAMVFVMFMLPYDVGNRVCIGREQSTGIIGNILSIDLLYTTVLTRFNEKVSTLSSNLSRLLADRLCWLLLLLLLLLLLWNS